MGPIIIYFDLCSPSYNIPRITINPNKIPVDNKCLIYKIDIVDNTINNEKSVKNDFITVLLYWILNTLPYLLSA